MLVYLPFTKYFKIKILKKSHTLPIIAVVGALAFFYFKKVKSSATNLRVGIAKIQLDSTKTKLANYLQLFFKVTLAIENPGVTPLTMTGINLTFLTKGQPIGNASDTGSIALKPKGITKATFTVSLTTGKLFTLIKDAVALIALKKPFSLNIKGDILTTAGTVTVDETKDVEWPT